MFFFPQYFYFKELNQFNFSMLPRSRPFQNTLLQNFKFPPPPPKKRKYLYQMMFLSSGCSPHTTSRNT